MFGKFRKEKPKSYSPPEMLEYPVSYEGIMKALAPYYQEQRPLDLFFELYVLDVLEKLPAETKTSLDEFSAKHPTFFENHQGDWKRFVVEESHLSETIEVAIWDLWIKNSETAAKDGWEAHPWHYAKLFLQNYFADDSRVDVWEPDTLSEAKKRIDEFRNPS